MTQSWDANELIAGRRYRVEISDCGVKATFDGVVAEVGMSEREIQTATFANGVYLEWQHGVGFELIEGDGGRGA